MSSKRKILPALGLSLMGLSAGVFTWYEWMGGREYINYEEVLVLNEAVVRGQEITVDNLSYAMEEKSKIIEGAVIIPENIIGLEAVNYIPAKTQLHMNYFENADLVLEQGEYIAQIPIEWTLSIPDSLRRGDEVIVYSVMYDKELVNSLTSQQQDVISVGNNSNNTNDDTTGNSDNEESENSASATVSEKKDSTSLNILNKVMDTKVAYVKDSANREVISIGEKDRLDGSSTIRAVEIVTTPENFQKIESQINQGAKLIVMYTDGNTVKSDSEVK